jgi:hypothetical protein
MAKTKLKAVPKALSLPEKIQAALRALEAGKAGYQRHDELLSEIETEMQAKGLTSATLPTGEVVTLVDQLATASGIPYGGKARRYKLKVSRASDVTAKL